MTNGVKSPYNETTDLLNSFYWLKYQTEKQMIWTNILATDVLKNNLRLSLLYGYDTGMIRL